MKSEIIELRKKIYKNLKEKAFSYETRTQELDEYLKNQKESSQRSFFKSSIDELTKQVTASDCIFLGDFHTFDQNIRNVLRIIKVLISENEKCIIALEMVNNKHQFYIDSYLGGHLTDLEFLECIDYNESWRFPWTHYKLIFEMAKEYKFPIIALNTDGTLIERDKYAAKCLADVNTKFPKKKILVLYGELHITKNKIPFELNLIKKKLQTCIIHQNLDDVYWGLIESNKQYEIVSFSKFEFCIISAPPWIKYESMIYWYENLIDDPDFDIHEYIIENGKKVFNDDTEEDFLHTCKEITKHLSLNIDLDELEDFNIYDHTSLDFVEESLFETHNRKIFNFYHYLMSTGQSFRYNSKNTYYCSSYSVNRLSYLAGIHIFHYYLAINKIETQSFITSRNQEHLYILFMLENMFAFFFSKIINPHRKCDMYQDLVMLQSRQGQFDSLQAHTLAMNTLTASSTNELISSVPIKTIHASALYVGHILGEYLYIKATQQKDSINLERSYLNTNIDNFSFQRIKSTLLSDQDFKNHLKRYF